MSMRLATASFVAVVWVQFPASIATMGVLAMTPSAAAAQDGGLADPATLRRIELVNDLERALRQAEAARLRGDCDRLESFAGMFHGMHMGLLAPDVAADFQRRWREISARPCPPESAAPTPPPQAKPEEPTTPISDAPPSDDIPTYDAEPAPPGFGGKQPTIGVPYRDPNDPMIIPLPPPEKKASGDAARQQEECQAGGQCEIGPDGTPRRAKPPK